MKNKILIVEDERITSRLIEKFLSELNFEIFPALTNGEDVLKFLETVTVDIILMDITLEGQLDGIETAEIIQKKYNTPFIFLTTSTDDSTINRAKKLKPFGYILKPFNREKLSIALEIALYRVQTETTLYENDEKFHAILKSIAETVIVLDKNEIITYINPVGQNFLKLEKIIGESFNSTIKFIQTEKNEEDESFKNNYILIENNKKVPVDFTSSPLKNQYNQIIGSVIIIRDISERVDHEIKLQENYSQIKTNIVNIVEAMARAVEIRDPFTAGHQKKVAHLAVEIAKELNLSKHIVEGINMAALIHDLGNLSIPAEILSKTGKISDIEMRFIKTHSEAGFNILKNINFPWPIAEIIYQHHEKIDGTGYPKGLKGDKILIESKIIHVADVVEAMTSHRPYRPALPIEVALGEIEKFSGIYYDKEIAENCINLFSQKNYQFPDYD